MRSAILFGATCLFMNSNALKPADEFVQVSANMPPMGPVATRNLAQQFNSGSSGSTSNTYVASSEETGHDWGWGSFVAGLCLIPFSLALIWQNEKKIVRFHEVIVAAKKEIKPDQDTEKINEGNEKSLVHMIGKARNDEKIVDEALNYSAVNCYRIIRTVEMYQRHETKSEEKQGDRTITKYAYSDKWSTMKIDSSHFY